MDDFEIELKNGFLEEALQKASEVEQCFLALEANPSDMENLNLIFRLAHNLKGSSKAVGFDELGALTHEFESFILRVKNGELQASAGIVNLLLRVNDFIQQMVQALCKDLNAKFDFQPLIDEMKNYSEGAGAETSEESPSEPQAEPSNADDSHETHASHEVNNEPVQHEPLHLETLLQSASASVATPATPAPKPQAQTANAPAKQNMVEESLRVSLSKVESLINFVGELVILQSVMREQISATGTPDQRKHMQQMEKVSKEIQDLAMGLRMVPVKPTFLKMQRIVRDTALSLEKDVRIDLIGEETEIDKTVLEKINDPLVHLIRNSVDHGIERADIRVANGKEAKGHVKLAARHQAGKLVIEVSDDGGGLNPEKLIAKAIEKKILKPGTTLSATEAYNLIFAPGFSTKEQVTDVSGRGVGMDVVKTNIQELGGEVQIDSELGKGTTFRVILPLTLAIVESMIVSVSGHKFVIPMNHVHENLQPTTKNVHHDDGIGDVLMLRSENLPLLRLAEFFGLKCDKKPEQMIAMVMREGRQPFAILVDDIIGQFQVVVKQLGAEAQNIKGVSGVTILGDGKPALILEPVDLLKRKRSTELRKVA